MDTKVPIGKLNTLDARIRGLANAIHDIGMTTAVPYRGYLVFREANGSGGELGFIPVETPLPDGWEYATPGRIINTYSMTRDDVFRSIRDSVGGIPILDPRD